MHNLLVEELNRKGHAIRIIPVRHLGNLKEEIERLYQNYTLENGFRSFLKGFYKFDLPETDLNLQSIIVVATPVPQTKVTFNTADKTIEAILPPTYKEYWSVPGSIEKMLNELLARGSYRVQRAFNLPEKLLAVYSGLGRYGRNNICYFPGMGSFALISSYFTDMPSFDQNNEYGIKTMKECEKCGKCIDACPTGAIVTDRFLMLSERCLTYQNEFIADDNFPEWIDPSWHNSIVGCLKCQINCPVNKDYKNNIQYESFNEEETASIMNKEPLDNLPETLLNKLDGLNLKEYHHVLARNLNVLFANSL